jgi:hypothetical protein
MPDFVLRENFKEFLAQSGQWEEAIAFKVVLVNGWTPPTQPSAGGAWDLFYSDLTAYEIALAGYTAGGKVVTATMPANEGTPNTHFRVADATWASLAAGTVNYAVLVQQDAVYTRVVGYVAVGLQQPDGGPYAVRWPSGGVIVW